MSDVSPETVARMLDGVTDWSWEACMIEQDPSDKAAPIERSQLQALLRFINWAREAVPALSTRLAEVEVQRDTRHREMLNADAFAEKHKRRAEASEAREAKLLGALVDHNDLLRSAMQIAKREGVEGEIGSTNWDAYYNRVAVVLKRHHETANHARAALQGATK